MQCIPAISSLTPITTAIPLIGVLALTAVKDAYDDIVSSILHRIRIRSEQRIESAKNKIAIQHCTANYMKMSHFCCCKRHMNVIVSQETITRHRVIFNCKWKIGIACTLSRNEKKKWRVSTCGRIISYNYEWQKKKTANNRIYNKTGLKHDVFMCAVSIHAENGRPLRHIQFIRINFKIDSLQRIDLKMSRSIAMFRRGCLYVRKIGKHLVDLFLGRVIMCSRNHFSVFRLNRIRKKMRVVRNVLAQKYGFNFHRFVCVSDFCSKDIYRTTKWIIDERKHYGMAI